MDIYLIIYRISGWIVILFLLYLGFIAIKNRNLWQGRHKFIGGYICWVAFTNFFAGIMALINVNNMFIAYLPLSFILKALYLKDEHKSKNIHYFTYLCIVIYIILQIYKAVDNEGYKQFNTLGAYSGYPFFMIYTIWNLTIMFREKTSSQKLRQNPDFWFTITILALAFASLTSTVLDDTSYQNSSDSVLYVLFSVENIINVILYYGYFKAIKLLR